MVNMIGRWKEHIQTVLVYNMYHLLHLRSILGALYVGVYIGAPSGGDLYSSLNNLDIIVHIYK